MISSKHPLLDEIENLDYKDEEIIEKLEHDEMSATEAGFMHGYIRAG